MKLRTTCVGKLQIFSDFVEPVHRTGFDGALRDWLTAFAGAPRPAEDDGDAARRSFRVLWPVAEGREFLIAALWASADSIGRRFPFAIYTQIKSRRVAANALRELPSALEPLWRSLQETAATNAGVPWVDLPPGGDAVANVQARLEGARLEPPPAPDEARVLRPLRGTNAVDFLDGLLSASHWALFPRIAWHLAQAGRRLAGGGLVGFRLPASSRISVIALSTFWLEVVDRASAGRRVAVPTLLLPLEDIETSGVWVLFREPSAADAPVLFGDADSHPYLIDLRRADAPASDRAAAFESFTRSLHDRIASDMSVWDLAGLPLVELWEAANSR